MYLFLFLVLILGPGCTDPKEQTVSDALGALSQWFEDTRDDARPPQCHAFGLVKFPDASCEDMAAHAAMIVPASRVIERATPLKCFGPAEKEVCGEFVEVEFLSADRSQRSIRELAVLRRDNGKFRLYWYRSDSLYTELTKRAEQAQSSTEVGQLEAKQERLEAAYNALIGRDPTLYAFVPCIDETASSSKMVGGLLDPDEISFALLTERAQRCPDRFCLTLVGTRLAALCP